MTTEDDRFEHSHGYVLDYRITVPTVLSSPYLHVLFHGFSRIESQVPPVFARRQWAGADQAVCLLLSDPIHRHTRDSACGWFLLGEDEFVPSVFRLVDRLRDRFHLQGTVWHGLSSGGYAATKFWLRSPHDDLAFVVSPHNDPTILPQWRAEAAPFSDLPGMGTPEAVTSMIRASGFPSAGRHLHAVMSEKDSYYAIHHLRPILEELAGHDGVRAALLRNGRGHGFIADSDYGSQLSPALRHWAQRDAGELATIAEGAG